MQVLISKFSNLQQRPGSQQKYLKIREVRGRIFVVGTVPTYHALQPVIETFGSSASYYVKVLKHGMCFRFKSDVNSEQLKQIPEEVKKTNKELSIINRDHEAA